MHISLLASARGEALGKGLGEEKPIRSDSKSTGGSGQVAHEERSAPNPRIGLLPGRFVLVDDAQTPRAVNYRARLSGGMSTRGSCTGWRFGRRH